MMTGQDASEDERQTTGARREPSGVSKYMRWTDITLYFADGSDLTSSWDVEGARAVQRGGHGRMDQHEATQEHLRALAELRDTGGATNWYANAECDPDANPRPDEIDWQGFVEPEQS